jgi:hypothetical protein
MNKKRNYKKEYANYQGKPEQVANRVKRNKARSEAVKDGRVKKGDNRDVDHIKPLRSNGSNSKKNTRIVPKSVNRASNGKRGGRKKK